MEATNQLINFKGYNLLWRKSSYRTMGMLPQSYVYRRDRRLHAVLDRSVA